MKTKTWGFSIAVALVFALPVQAQSVYSYGYHGTSSFSASGLAGQLAIDSARGSLGYVNGGPSIMTPEAQKEIDYVAAITKAYQEDQAALRKQECDIVMRDYEQFEKERAKYGWPDLPAPVGCQ